MVNDPLEEMDPGYVNDPEEPRNEVEAFLQESIQSLSATELICAEPQATLDEAIRTMNRHRIGALLVVEGEKLVGILTERDILTKVVGRRFDLTQHHVADYMTKNPDSLSETHAVAFALNKMVVGGYRHVPIVSADGKPVGIVSMREIMDHLVDHFPAGILNLPPEPGLAFKGRHGG